MDRLSSLIRRMVRIGTIRMKMNETFEKSVPTEELALSTLPKAKKMPAMTRKQPINT